MSETKMAGMIHSDGHNIFHWTLNTRRCRRLEEKDHGRFKPRSKTHERDPLATYIVGQS